MNNEAIAAFLYDEVERNLREFYGDGAAPLPFGKEDMLKFIRRRALDNREDFSTYDTEDDMDYSETLYFYGLRRVPEEEDLERLRKMRLHFEKLGKVRLPACGSVYREQVTQGIIHSEEARLKNLHILHNPYDRRNAVRELDRKGKDGRP